MRRYLLTDAFCDAALPPAKGNRIDRDKEIKGFGLRTTAAGAKSFVLKYYLGGREFCYTIGTFRDPWKTAAARKEALRLKGLVDQGIDVQAEKHARRTAPTLDQFIREDFLPWARRGASARPPLSRTRV